MSLRFYRYTLKSFYYIGNFILGVHHDFLHIFSYDVQFFCRREISFFNAEKRAEAFHIIISEIEISYRTARRGDIRKARGPALPGRNPFRAVYESKSRDRAAFQIHFKLGRKGQIPVRCAYEDVVRFYDLSRQIEFRVAEPAGFSQSVSLLQPVLVQGVKFQFVQIDFL